MTSLAASGRLQDVKDVNEYCIEVLQMSLAGKQSNNSPLFDTRSSLMTDRMAAEIFKLNDAAFACPQQLVGILFSDDILYSVRVSGRPLCDMFAITAISLH